MLVLKIRKEVIKHFYMKTPRWFTLLGENPQGKGFKNLRIKS